MLDGSGLIWAAALLGGDLLAHRGFAREVLDRGGHLRVGSRTMPAPARLAIASSSPKLPHWRAKPAGRRRAAQRPPEYSICPADGSCQSHAPVPDAST